MAQMMIRAIVPISSDKGKYIGRFEQEDRNVTMADGDTAMPLELTVRDKPVLMIAASAMETSPGDQTMIFAVKALMTLATLCYAIGYASRRRDNLQHRRMMLTGFVLTLATAAVLVSGVYGLGGTYRSAYWLIRATGAPERARWVLIAHRIIAAVTLSTLIAQVVTGWRRAPLHGRLYPYTIGLWLITFVSGMFIFA